MTFITLSTLQIKAAWLLSSKSSSHMYIVLDYLFFDYVKDMPRKVNAPFSSILVSVNFLSTING